MNRGKHTNIFVYIRDVYNSIDCAPSFLADTHTIRYHCTCCTHSGRSANAALFRTMATPHGNDAADDIAEAAAAVQHTQHWRRHVFDTQHDTSYCVLLFLLHRLTCNYSRTAKAECAHSTPQPHRALRLFSTDSPPPRTTRIHFNATVCVRVRAVHALLSRTLIQFRRPTPRRCFLQNNGITAHRFELALDTRTSLTSHVCGLVY